MLSNKYRRTILRIRLEFNLKHYGFCAIYRILSLVDDIRSNKGISSLKRNTGHMDMDIRIAYKLVILCASKVAKDNTDGLLHWLTGIYGTAVFLLIFVRVFFRRPHIVSPSHIQIDSLGITFDIETDPYRRRQLKMCRGNWLIIIIFTGSKILTVFKCHVSINFLLTCTGILFIVALNIEHSYEIGIARIFFQHFFLISGTDEISPYSINNFLSDL